MFVVSVNSLHWQTSDKQTLSAVWSNSVFRFNMFLFFFFFFQKSIPSALSAWWCTVACISAALVISSLAPSASSAVSCSSPLIVLPNLHVYLSGFTVCQKVWAQSPNMSCAFAPAIIILNCLNEKGIVPTLKHVGTSFKRDFVFVTWLVSTSIICLLIVFSYFIDT